MANRIKWFWWVEERLQAQYQYSLCRKYFVANRKYLFLMKFVWTSTKLNRPTAFRPKQSNLLSTPSELRKKETGIPGNVAAHVAAKAVYISASIFNIPHSRTRTAATVKAAAKHVPFSPWALPRYHHSYLDPNPTSRAQRVIPRRAEGILYMVRRGVVYITEYFHRINCVASPDCDIREIPETVDHLLCERLLYACGREELEQPCHSWMIALS